MAGSLEERIKASVSAKSQAMASAATLAAAKRQQEMEDARRVSEQFKRAAEIAAFSVEVINKHIKALNDAHLENSGLGFAGGDGIQFFLVLGRRKWSITLSVTPPMTNMRVIQREETANPTAWHQSREVNILADDMERVVESVIEDFVKHCLDL